MRSLVTRDISVLERANADRARASRFSARTNHGWSRAAQQSIPVSSLPVRATSFAIEYRDDDNKSQITREDGTVIAYDYDDAKRLIEEKWTASDQTVLHHFQYTYDATGNRLTKDYNGITTDYDYNALNQLTQEQTGSAVTEYAYDRDGNTIRKAEPSKTTLYSWNHENMLTKVATSDDSATRVFGYDHSVLRSDITDENNRTQIQWAGVAPLLTRNGDTTKEVFVHRLSAIAYPGSLLGIEQANGDRWVLHDWVGSLHSLVDSSGNVTYAAERSAYGDVAGQPSGQNTSALGFLEKPHDMATELAYFGRRDYVPSTGRFLTLDPIRHGANWYTYAEAKPTYAIDLFGLMTLSEWQALTPEAKRRWYVSVLGGYKTQLAASGRKHRLEPRVIAAVILAEQADQPVLKQAKHTVAGLAGIDHSTGMGQIHPSLVAQYELIDPVLAQAEVAKWRFAGSAYATLNPQSKLLYWEPLQVLGGVPSSSAAKDHRSTASGFPPVLYAKCPHCAAILLADNEINIDAAAAYIRRGLADAAAAAQRRGQNTGRYKDEFDFSAFIAHSSEWWRATLVPPNRRLATEVRKHYAVRMVGAMYTSGFSVRLLQKGYREYGEAAAWGTTVASIWEELNETRLF